MGWMDNLKIQMRAIWRRCYIWGSKQEFEREQKHLKITVYHFTGISGNLISFYYAKPLYDFWMEISTYNKGILSPLSCQWKNACAGCWLTQSFMVIFNSSSILKNINLNFASGYLQFISPYVMPQHFPSQAFLYDLTSKIVPIPNILTCCLFTPSTYLRNSVIFTFILHLQDSFSHRKEAQKS